MLAYIPLEKSIKDFQKLLNPSVWKGKIDLPPAEIIQQLRNEPIYNVDKVLEDVTHALVADNQQTNCLVGNCSEHVVVTREKLDQVLNIIRNGGKDNGSDDECNV